MPIYWPTMQMHQGERPLVDEIIKYACRYNSSKNTSNAVAEYERLKKSVYDFYTFNFLTYKFIDDFLKDMQSDKSKVAQYQSYKKFMDETVYPAMDSAAQKLGFDSDSNPGWKSYKKNIVGFDGPNYKFYLTVTNGLDFATYNSNIQKFVLLLAALAKAPVQGTFSVKFSSTYFGMLKHKDTIVIHFKWPGDAQPLWGAVNSVGLKLYPREDLHRIELGLDKQKGNFDSSDDSSDSQLTAAGFLDSALQGILSPASCSKSISPEIVFRELMRAQFEAAHRQHVNLQYK